MKRSIGAMRTFHAAVLVTAVLVVTFLAKAEAVASETAQTGNVRIEMPWARASIGTGRPAAAFVTIVNDGPEADRLIKIETPTAEKVEIHQTTTVNGVSRMNRVEDLRIAPAGRIEFRPGSLHIMLTDLREPLRKGESFPLDIYFEKNGHISLTIPIAGPGASKPSQ